MHPAARRRVLRRAVAVVKGDLRRISFGHIESALGLLAPGSGDRSLHFPGGIRLRSIRDKLIVTGGKHPRGPKADGGSPGGGIGGFCYRQETPGCLHIDEIGHSLGQHTGVVIGGCPGEPEEPLWPGEVDGKDPADPLSTAGAA